MNKTNKTLIIEKKLEEQDFKSKNIRDIDFVNKSFDQKITYDIMKLIITVSLELKDEDLPINTRNIIAHETFIETVTTIFNKKKPEPGNHSEYEKWCSHSLRFLIAAGLLFKEGRNKPYVILDESFLKLLSNSDYSLIFFINCFYIKVFKEIFDINILEYIDTFDYQNKDEHEIGIQNYKKFVLLFVSLIKKHTNIKNDAEIRRYIAKFMNIILHCNGYSILIKDGKLNFKTVHNIDLSYNKSNFRDVNKNKGMTRKEYDELEVLCGLEDQNTSTTNESVKAKKAVRKIHGNNSELDDRFNNNDSSIINHMHHIFSQSTHPSLAGTMENIIAITPDQHLGKAHPNGNTNEMDSDYQVDCLIAKLASIQKHKEYSIESFINVLNIGFNLKLDINRKYKQNELRKIILQSCN